MEKYKGLAKVDVSQLSKLLDEIKLTILMPRLDSNVTAQINHLIKCPFSCHPDTGKISIPLSLDEVENFDPDVVPKIGDNISDRAKKFLS